MVIASTPKAYRNLSVLPIPGELQKTGRAFDNRRRTVQGDIVRKCSKRRPSRRRATVTAERCNELGDGYGGPGGDQDRLNVRGNHSALHEGGPDARSDYNVGSKGAGFVADALGLKQATGALVDEPQSGSPAEKAGIKADDVIVSVDGMSIQDSRELAQKIGTMSPGSSIRLGVTRDGNQQTMTVMLGQLLNQQQARAGTEEQDKSSTSAPRLGLSLAPAATGT
jgi:hypothetical protein